MPSSASTILRLELPAEGEKTGQWDDIENLNKQMLEAAIAGTTSISTTGGTTTLTNVDYTNDQAKKRVLNVSGALVSNATIVIPNASKTYLVVNRTTGSYTLTIKTSSGSGIAVTQSTACEVYCDGSNTVRYMTPMTDYSTGAPATSSGGAASSVSVSATGNLSSTNVQAALAELQGDIDTINTSLSNKQGLDSDLTTLAGLSNTKGNLIIGGDAGAWTALTVGTTGLVLRANSSTTTGTSWAAGLPYATCTIFYQAAAPVGWTIGNNTFDDMTIKVNNTTGGGTSSGSTSFGTVFAARTITQANLPNVNFTVTDPGHTHTTSEPTGSQQVTTSGAGLFAHTVSSGTTTSASSTTGITVNSGGSGTAMDFNVKHLIFTSAIAS